MKHLHNLVRSQIARMRRIATFDLDCGVLNAKLVMERVTNKAQKTILTSRVGHHDMCGQGRLGGAHAPDVEIVNIAHTRQRPQICLNRRDFNVFRHGVKRQIQTVTQQALT